MNRPLASAGDHAPERPGVAGPRWGLLGIGLVSAYLALCGLDDHLFWDDEANVGFFARNLWLGHSLSGWDGNNLWGFRNGALLDQQLLNRVDPPLQYLVAACGFSLFGVSTWAARLPFVLIGLASIPLLDRFLREYDTPAPTRHLALALYGLHTSFLLYIRQARYYSLSLTLGLATYLMFVRYMRTGRPLDLAGLMACGALLFASNYLVAVATLAALAAVWMAFHQAKDLRKLVLPAGALLVAAVAYVAFTGHLLGLLRQMVPEGLLSELILLGMYLADINELSWLPWVVALAAIHRIVRRDDRRLSEWVFFSLIFVLAAVVLSPQPVSGAEHADVRYVVSLLPVFTAISGTIIGSLGSANARLLVTVIAAFTNLLSLNPLDPRVRSDFAGHVYEVHTDYDTATDAVQRLLAEHADPGDRVLVRPEEDALPFIFYGASHFRVVGQLKKDTHLPRERIERLDPELFVEEAEPDWIVLFGWNDRHEAAVRASARRGAHYELFTVLDVYPVNETRPEIFWHSFGPRRNPDLETGGVHVFKKVRPGVAPGVDYASGPSHTPS
jgi:hypothetical protein